MPDQDLGRLVRVEEDDVLRHRVLDEEVLEVPQPEVGDLGRLGVGGHQNVAGLEVSVHHGAPQGVQVAEALPHGLME